MSGGRSIRCRKSGFQPDRARGPVARTSTGKIPVVPGSQDGYLPEKETK